MRGGRTLPHISVTPETPRHITRYWHLRGGRSQVRWQICSLSRKFSGAKKFPGILHGKAIHTEVLTATRLSFCVFLCVHTHKSYYYYTPVTDMSSPSEPLPPAHTPASGCESPHPAKTVEESVLASPAKAQVPAQPQCEVTDGGDPPKVVGDNTDDTDGNDDDGDKTQNGKKRKAKSPENFPSKKVRTRTENPKEYLLCVPSSETYRWDPEQIKKTTAKALGLHPRWKMRFAKVVQREDGY